MIILKKSIVNGWWGLACSALEHFHRLLATRITCLQIYFFCRQATPKDTPKYCAGAWLEALDKGEGREVWAGWNLFVILWSNWFLNLTPCAKRLSDENSRPTTTPGDLRPATVRTASPAASSLCPLLELMLLLLPKEEEHLEGLERCLPCGALCARSLSCFSPK